MKVILALDDSEFSDTAMESVARRAWPVGSEITAIHVVELDLDIHNGKDTDDLVNLNPYKQDIVNHAKKLIDSRVKTLAARLPGCKIEGTVLQGNARDALIHALDKYEPDLVVMGSHGRTGIKKFVLGSVAESVLHQATCPVEIVKAGTVESGTIE